MTSHNNLILNRLFTQNTLHNLLEENDEEIYAKIVRSYIDDPYSKKNSEIITFQKKLLQMLLKSHLMRNAPCQIFLHPFTFLITAP